MNLKELPRHKHSTEALLSPFPDLLAQALSECQQTSVIIADADHHVVFSTPAAARLIETEPFRMLDKSIHDFLIHVPSSIGEHYAELLKSDRTVLPVRLSVSTQTIGRTRYHCFIISDASEHHLVKRLQESEDRFRMLSENAPVMIWMLDQDKKATYYNKIWDDFFLGEGDDEAMQMQVHPQDIDETGQQFHSKFNERAEFNLEYRALHQDGTYHWIMDHGVPRFLNDGTFIGYVGTCVDIHKQKMLQVSLQLASHELERKVEERTSQLALANEKLHLEKLALEKAKHEAEAANEAKTGFLATISHELRTPIGAIMGYSEILKDVHRSEQADSECLDAILRNGRHLLELINDILDLSSIEEGKLKLAERDIDLFETIETVVSLIRPNNRHEDIDFQLSLDENLPPRVCLDPTRFRQILINIVGNAFKFTKKGHVHVRVSFYGKKLEKDTNPAGTLRIDVSDTGIGIDPEKSHLLFQPFSQIDSSLARSFEGTGLGLALARKIARAMGGDLILLQSSENQGSTFRAEFRCRVVGSAPPIFASAIAPLAVLGALADRSILLIEDCTDNQILYAHFLKRAGAVVDLAASGSEGLVMSAAKCPPYDAILVDIQMPDMNGYQVTEHLRSIGYKNPIIALTALAMEHNKSKCLAAGCNDFLTKPIGGKPLIEAIVRCLNN